jgi:hypothetical protein
MDALNYLCTSAESAGRTPEGLPCAVIDCIGAAGTQAQVPTWSVFTTVVEGSGAWVEPTPVVVPPPPPAPSYPSEVEWWGPVYEARVAQCYAEAGRVFPDSPAAFRWFSRCAYDIGAGMPKEASMARHISELRAALGLP